MKSTFELPDRERLYDSYLKIQSDKIITVVENAIKGAKQELEKLVKAKEERVKSILDTLTLDFKPYSTFNPEQAFKTLRKLPLFGSGQGVQPDYEWPKLIDI